MGHSYYGYERFDKSLTRPLYGYVTELKSGSVPRWVKKPSPSAWEIERLWGLDVDGGEIPRSKLPTGVRKDSGGRGPVSYHADSQTYLDQHRERIGTADDKRRYSMVRYTVNTGRTARRGRDTVPSDIADRLSAVRDTTKWDRQIDGYHEQFREWKLIYDLGPRGGITDARIVADVHH